MTRGKDFMKRWKCKNNHCSSMSITAWCDLNNMGGILIFFDHCSNPKCKCRKKITFTPR